MQASRQSLRGISFFSSGSAASDLWDPSQYALHHV